MKAAALALILALALSLGGCSGGDPPGPPPGVVSAVAERDIVDDAPQVSSTIEVTFDREIEIPRAKVPLASNFELRVPVFSSEGNRVKTHLVKSAEVKDGSPR